MEINLRHYEGFAVAAADTSLEATRLRTWCLTQDVHVPIYNAYAPELVPYGSVEWCETALGHHVQPDYYPLWLWPQLHRKVWRSQTWELGCRLFVKPADAYKRFDGFVTTGTYKKKKKGPYWWSEVVGFIDEWRYYVSAGVVAAAAWYQGENEDAPAPALEIELPQWYNGALDFGRLKDGDLALVEAQHPFACGWYGDGIEPYLQWIIDGWKYMTDAVPAPIKTPLKSVATTK